MTQTQDNAQPETFTIARTGLPPIKFTGTMIGSGTTHSHNCGGRWTRVTLYRSKGGKFLASVAHLTQWQGEIDRYSGGSFTTPKELIAWLGRDNDGILGRASQEAVEEAVEANTTFADDYVVVVE